MRHFSYFLIVFAIFFANSAWSETVLYQNIPRITIKSRLYGEGNITIHLTKQRHLLTNSKSKFYQGEISRKGATYPVAADYINQTLRVTFPGKITGSRKSRQRVIRLTISGNKIRSASVPYSFLSHKTCNTEGHLESGVISNIEPQNLMSYKVLTIEAFSDLEWNNLYGNLSEHEIASVINTAEAIYEQQLGIRFKIVSISTLATSPTSDVASDILTSFRTSGVTVANANTHHLFTGRDMQGSTIGIAYVSAICWAPQYAFGVSQSYGVLTSVVFAHEIGHNLGAVHDSSSAGIMNPMIGPSATNFSPKSISDITNHLAYFGSCILDEQLPPSLHGATLHIKRRNTKAVITLLSRNTVPLQNTAINIKIGNKIYVAYTNELGKIIISLPKKRNTKIRIEASLVEDVSIVKKVVFKI